MCSNSSRVSHKLQFSKFSEWRRKLRDKRCDSEAVFEVLRQWEDGQEEEWEDEQEEEEEQAEEQADKQE